jgi:hypothetical protein
LGENGMGLKALGIGHIVEFGNRKSEKELLITDLEKGIKFRTIRTNSVLLTRLPIFTLHQILRHIIRSEFSCFN